MKDKLIVSECCNAPVEHYPTMGLNPMEKVTFFCTKCDKNCKTKIIKKEKADNNKI
jgi:hypothetical protein